MALWGTPSPLLVGPPSSSLASAPLHLVSPSSHLEVSVLFQPLFWLSLCLDPFPYHTPRVKGGVSRCFLFMVSQGLGCSVRTFLASAELKVTRYHVCDSVSVPPGAPLSHPLPPGIALSAFVSFRLSFSSFWLSSLGALCSCRLFVSASLLPLLPLSAPKSCDLSISGVWGAVEVAWGWAPSIPGDDSNGPGLPRVIIHIYEVERTDTTM